VATAGAGALVSFLAGVVEGASSPESSRAAKKFDDCDVSKKQTAKLRLIMIDANHLLFIDEHLHR
jgi:hypothetical protein